ncbi:hypothetical protein [uncultured Thiodictyon sp.]|uniref:hypothetical protein n=1 Tax=uncultured Thiodictyon sp. TaxID=1846217 RepID=UPI0025E35CD7|nr:hypothetical protein [uncultured Thiodictyon sp.]
MKNAAAKPETKKEAAKRDQVDRQPADAITLKASIADPLIDGVLTRYGLTVDSDAPRHIYFFDTPDLTLLKAGIIARARRISGDDHDSTVKFHPVVAADIPAMWRECDGFQLERDLSETGAITSASLTVPVSKGAIKQVAAGEKGIAKLFSKEQEAFLTAVGGPGIAYEGLCVLGPVAGHCWTLTDPAYPWRITAELWQREDGTRLMEVAIKAPLIQAEVASAGFMVFMQTVGAQRHMKPQTKTRWILRHYVKAAPAESATVNPSDKAEVNRDQESHQ